MTSRWLAVLVASALGCGAGGEVEAPPEPTKAESPRPSASPRPTPTPERLVIEVVGRHPHDRGAFTQGLLWHRGRLYEGTGLHGRSDLRMVEPASGVVERRVPLPPDLFGEGLARVGERLYQLTWHAGIARVYDLNTFDLVDELGYRGEGWGLASDGHRLFMTDGSAAITVREPDGFSIERRMTVTEAGRPVTALNELEWAAGALWANVWQQDRVLRIDPANGAVTGIVDARGLLSPTERRGTDVMNGIAYDPESETFWLTGKWWPVMFQVRIRPEA